MEKKPVLKMQEELIKDMNANLPGILTMSDIQKIRYGKGIKIPFYINDTLNSSDISNLDLSVRAYNTLKRAGFHTVGDIINRLDSMEDLK